MAVDIPDKVTPLGPGEPEEVANPVTQSGGTFAERAGGKAPAAKKLENSTFAARAKTASKTASKAVDEDTDGAENKAVKKAAATKKTAAKKS